MNTPHAQRSPALTLAQCLSQAQALGLARVDAQMLLLHSLQRSVHERAWLLAHDTDVLPPAQQAAWHMALYSSAHAIAFSGSSRGSVSLTQRPRCSLWFDPTMMHSAPDGTRASMYARQRFTSASTFARPALCFAKRSTGSCLWWCDTE